MNIRGLRSLFKALLLIGTAMPLASPAQQPYKSWDTGSDTLICKEIATHRIVDPKLIDLIVEYDRMYAPFVDDSLGIILYCSVNTKTITYSIGYSVGIASKGPILLCEPINGREVYIDFFDLYRQVELPHPRAVELLKHSNPRQYRDFVEKQKECDDYGDNALVMMSVTSSFVTWKIVFNKDTGKCIRKETPDKTRFYEQQRRKMNR